MSGEKSPECRGRVSFPFMDSGFRRNDGGTTGERGWGSRGYGLRPLARLSLVTYPTPGGKTGVRWRGPVRRHVGRETPIRTGMSKSPPGPLCWDSVVDAVICSIAAFCLSRTFRHATWAVWGFIHRRGRRGFFWFHLAAGWQIGALFTAEGAEGSFGFILRLAGKLGLYSPQRARRTQRFFWFHLAAGWQIRALFTAEGAEDAEVLLVPSCGWLANTGFIYRRGRGGRRGSLGGNPHPDPPPCEGEGKHGSASQNLCVLCVLCGELALRRRLC